MPAVPRAADRAAAAEAHRRARQERGVAAARHRRHDRQPARPRPPLPRRAADRHVSSGLSAAQPAGQGEGMGGPAAGAGDRRAIRPRRGVRLPSHEAAVADAIACTRAQPAPYCALRASRGPFASAWRTHVEKNCRPVAAVVVMTLAGCGYNDLQRQDEGIKAAWSEVVNQYQRRADLVPNLVNTVKGYAAQEADVLTAVTNARANVGAIKATPELINDPAAFAKFQAGAGPADERAVAAARRRRELSEPQVRRAVPRPAVAARGHGEPHHRRAQALHRHACRRTTRRCARSRPT